MLAAPEVIVIRNTPSSKPTTTKPTMTKPTMTKSLREDLRTVPSPVGTARDTRARAASRAALAAVLWTRDGQRRLPRERALVAALQACDERDVWWVCEACRAGPVYLLPTREWIEHLARQLDTWKAKTVVEVAAGDGFLSACLRAARPRLRVHATDDFSWTQAKRRMTSRDRSEFRGVAFSGIRPSAQTEQITARAAVEKYRPDVVLVSWAPPGTLVERVIRGPCLRVVDISVDGDVCGNGMRTWRFHKEFLEGPLEDRALCRLDARPRAQRHTRVTAYYGKGHPEFDSSD